ncbi:hypothetical protein FA15DRAFT_692416 [Coprinopsis marcescibilis]|uniref:Uncharacterized protein n=1 Tax=Coprinopsis marcescibilis TaxID=230819 RepID=A0A5C3L4S3_COPMA|nr:hypothetical protein FA15DRAFT_692416 [Coprinopsis marcescibilis]
MYLPSQSVVGLAYIGLSGVTGKHVAQSTEGYEWFDAILLVLGSSLAHVCLIFGRWSRLIVLFINDIVRNPSVWTFPAFDASYRFFQNHPHIVYLASLSIFFGPIILLVPFLLLQEIGVLFAFNLSFASHGLIPGRVEDHYETLKEHFMESKEKVFASVEAATSVFNDWTSEHPLLMIFRVLSGLLGLYVLYGLWSGWNHPQ